MTITQLRVILKAQGLGARKIPTIGSTTRYAITMNGEALFSLDLTELRDAAHAKERIQQELANVKEVATRRWQ